jgi:hypothetical protein
VSISLVGRTLEAYRYLFSLRANSVENFNLEADFAIDSSGFDLSVVQWVDAKYKHKGLMTKRNW